MHDIQIHEHLSRSANFTPFCAKWLNGPFLAVAGELLQLEQSILREKTTMTHKFGLKCMSVIDTRTLTFGDFGGEVFMSDLETLKPVWSELHSEKKIVNAIDTCGGASKGPLEIISGARDGTVKLWDPRTSDPVITLEPSTSGIDCWTVTFGNCHSDTDRNIVAGYDNGDVKMFDLRTMALSWETNVKNGVCQVSFDRKDILMNKLSVSTLEGQLYVFDMRTLNTQSGYTNCQTTVGKGTIWGCNYLPQNREIFATNDGCGNVALFKYCYPNQRFRKDNNGENVGVAGSLESLCPAQNFSSQPIVSFNWHPEKKGLAILTSIDQQIKVAIVTKLETI